MKTTFDRLFKLLVLWTCPFFLFLTVAGAQAPGDPPAIVIEPYGSGFSSPVHITHAADGAGRLFVVEQPGRIQIMKNGGTLPVPFLDISDRVSCCGERGLLSVAFPPDYAMKGYFYVNYTNLSGDTVVARYHISANPDVADAATEEILLTIAQPFANHNGGQLAFGPDGYLYIGTGDGGSGGDPFNNGQSTNVLLGKILRIDVEAGIEPYAIPATNPFQLIEGYRPEIWALGLRNPWRFSFDTLTGDLFIGDVGQNEYEEINFQPAESTGGENYGWRIMEGFHCYNPAECDPT
ncbi:MAG: sorbosone dehydrogenase family protein, partial [Desulfatirhabdiaceae bacterium]